MRWLASQSNTKITRAITPTDSVNLLQKEGSGKDCSDWTVLHSLRFLILEDQLPWPHWRKRERTGRQTGKQGRHHSGRVSSVGMNGQIDWQARQKSQPASVSQTLAKLGTQERLPGHPSVRLSCTKLRNWFPFQNLLVENGKKASDDQPERTALNQNKTPTVLKATLGGLLTDGAKHVWTLPSAAERELKTERTRRRGVKGY